MAECLTYDPALDGWSSLTRAQRRVAVLAAEGLSNPEIAQRLTLSRGTVKAHLAASYRKLGLANRLELAVAVARAARAPVS